MGVLKTAEVYKAELTQDIEKHVTENIMKAKGQAADSHKFSGLANET